MTRSGAASLAIISALAFGRTAFAQDRDFLTPNEVDQIREAQDVTDRLKLYVHFARQRLDLVQQALSKDKAGRSLAVHNALEDYTRMIEAMDSVADDAIRRKVAVEKGLVLVASAEQDLLKQLDKVQSAEPKDLERYKFVLQQAIDTTTDSRELTLEDTAKRSADLAATDAKEQKDRESMMSDKERKERTKSAATAKADGEQKKSPSLYKPGEKPPDQPQ